MTVSLYTVTGDINIFSRVKTQIGSDMAAFQAADELNIESPDILIDYDASYLACNYVYIQDFSRYYDVTGKVVVNGNQIRMSLLSDVLASFPDIKTSPCIAGRSTSHPNHNLVDPLVAFKPIPKRSVRTIGDAFTPGASDGSYILTVGGK